MCPINLLWMQRAAYPRLMRVGWNSLRFAFFSCAAHESGGCDHESSCDRIWEWTFVQWSAGREKEKPVSLKIRTLLIDGRVKDFYARRAARSDGKAVCSAARF